MFRVCRRLYHPNTLEHAAGNRLRPLAYGQDSPQYRVLQRALEAHVPTLGFNERAIVRAAGDLGYGSTVLSALAAPNSPALLNVPSAVLELVKFHLVTKRVALADAAAQGSMSMEQLFLQRVEADRPLAGQLTQLLSILSLPGEFLVNTAMPELFRLSDDLIYYSGEKDHPDIAWYSKRAAVAMAYVSTNLFMARDRSPGLEETLHFARRRLQQVDSLGTAYNNVEEFAWYQLLMAINLVKSQLTRG
ncbi:AaceriACL147Wp [[Ashbya] aceris (nom. inval.)]|nr:AaceriACL147Wp [[Ashbya] aceris (nom. inval.)]